MNFGNVVGLVLGLSSVVFFLWVMFTGANQKRDSFRVYIAGTMSGNSNDTLVDQSYRKRIADILIETYPDIVIDDPLKDHQGSLEYDDEKAKVAFADCLRRSSYEADMVVAYIPEASMGTALEIYEAFRNGKYIVIITPLLNNWIVRLYGDIAFSSIESFAAWVYDHALDPFIYGGINDFDGSRIWKS